MWCLLSSHLLGLIVVAVLILVSLLAALVALAPEAFKTYFLGHTDGMHHDENGGHIDGCIIYTCVMVSTYYVVAHPYCIGYTVCM